MTDREFARMHDEYITPPDEEPATLNGNLSPAQMDALNFTYAKHLQVVGELDDANDQIAEYRVKLAECQAREKAKDEFIAMLEDKLSLAVTDRQMAMNKHAEDTVKLDMLRKILEKPPENGG